MKTRTGCLIALLLASGAASAANCALDAQYVSRVQEIAKAKGGDTAATVQQKIDACPSYDSYQSMGMLLGHSKNRRDWLGASQAFVGAESLASSPKMRAETLFQYASLVNDDLDPQNAYPMIKKAQALDPGRKDIAQLSAEIEKQIQAPKKEQLERSFGLSVYRPLKSSARNDGAVTGAGHRQINVPINFEFNSVDLSNTTRENLPLLASALAKAASQGPQQFEFVGHSDSSGDEKYNTDLSRRRADAVRDAVVQLQPSLNGKIKVEGVGSSDPIDNGNTPQAMQANRRLQVLLNEK